MKIAIAGYGIEGKANFEYWNTPENELTIVDERDALDDLPVGASTILGKGAFSKLEGFDIVIRTAGLDPAKIMTDGKVWSSTNEFLEKCPARIIGVTGTKGKGTTCSLITSILKAAGKTVHLVGNIGTSPLSVLADIKSEDVVVFELSSFQLWDAQKSPHIAVILPIEPDHLDIHHGMDDYVRAKANIRRFQLIDDCCIYHPTNKIAEEVAGTQLVNFNAGNYGGSIEFAHRYGIRDDDEVYIEDGYFCVQDRKICSIDNLKLPGAHNLENACAAMSAVTELWGDVTDDQFATGLRSFTGLPHRLKFIAEKCGVKYYDDSIATTPGSAIAAIHSFTEPILLILGGHEKGADYSELMLECRDEQVCVLAMGANREQIADLCGHYGVDCSIEPGTMRQVVARAAMESKKGSIVVLSPAAASFDMFKNYQDRGDQFVAAVNSLQD